MSSCSASCAIHKGSSEPEYTVLHSMPSTASSLQPPTSLQLSRLTALPSAGVVETKKTKKKSSVHFSGRVFNPQASRPFPALTSPSRIISVTLEQNVLFATTSTSVTTFGASAFTLNQFPGYAEYTACFDQYRFDEIEAWIEPTLLASSTVSTCPYYTAVDFDDANVPTARSQVSLKQGALVSETGAAHYHRWQPHMAVALYSGAFTSYGNVPASWIDVASPSVQHFGIKFACSDVDGVARPFQLTYRAKLSFRAAGI